MATPIIAATQLQILAILDNGPSYAAKMLAEHPDLANTTPREGKNGIVMVVDPGGLYVKLKRLANRELIERVPNFRPKNWRELPSRVRTRAVWYRLTPQGRELLQEHRRTIRK